MRLLKNLTVNKPIYGNENDFDINQFNFVYYYGARNCYYLKFRDYNTIIKMLEEDMGENINKEYPEDLKVLSSCMDKEVLVTVLILDGEDVIYTCPKTQFTFSVKYFI